MSDQSSAKQIRIFDRTLRDGEQAPGCSMTVGEKLRVAKALSELKVDIIEAGFPAASPGDFESVKAIADRNFGPVICGLARCNAADIEKVHAAVKGADNHRIHVFVATSAIHREHKLKMAKEEIIKSAVGAIQMAVKNSGETDNTIIIFTSDNGSHWLKSDIDSFRHDANRGRIGMKSDVWDGGHRVPFVVQWPEKISAGTNYFSCKGCNDGGSMRGRNINSAVRFTRLFVEKSSQAKRTA